MIRRTLHVSWMTVALLLLAVGIAFYYFGWTERGLRSVASLLSRRVGPVTLQIENVSGTLAGGAHIGHFVLDHRRTHLVARDAELRLAMWPLLWQTIHMERADIAHLDIRVLPRPDEKSDWKPHFLPRLLTLRVDAVNIAAGRLITTRGREYEATAIRARGVVHPGNIRIYEGALVYSDINVRLAGEIGAAQPIKLAGNLRFDSHPAGQPQYAGRATVSGDLDRLPINGEITEPFAADFHGAAEALNADWHWAGDSIVQRLDLRAWNAGNALGIITGKLRLTGNGAGFQADGSLLPPGLEAGPLHARFDGNYGNRVLDVRRLSFLHEPSGTLLTANGEIGVIANGPRLDLKGEWRTLTWPMAAADAPVHSRGGSYTLNGLWPYTLQAHGELTVKDLPSMQFSGGGLLYTDRLQIDRAVFDAFNGQALLTGTAWWTPSERWQAQGHMKDFDITSLRPGVRGRLHFDLKASGVGYGADSSIESTFSNLSGNVRAQRAGGHAHVHSDGEDWVLDDVRLQLGATRIEATGRIGLAADLNFDVKADDLALFAEQARGQLSARGRLRAGGSSAPRLELNATGHSLAWADTRIGELGAQVDFDPAGSGHAESQLRLSGLELGGRHIQELSFTTHGRAGGHEAALQVSAPRLKLSASGPAAYLNEEWRWQITRVTTDDLRKLHMQLETPTELRLSAAAQQLQRLCLHQDAARFCFGGRHDPAERSLLVIAEQMPLGALTAGLSTSTEFSGSVGLQLDAAARGNAPWSAQLRTQLNSAAAQHRLPGGRTELFNIGSGSISADLAGDGLRAKLALDSGSAGFINGSLVASNTDPTMGNWPLQGNLRLESEALSVLDSYLTEVDRISGRVAATLQLAGTLNRPELEGELRVSGGEVDAYQINLALRDLNFIARLKGDALTLNGSASAGVDGSASFDGQIAWRNQLPYGSLHLAGKDLRVVNVPEARVQASPDVQLKLGGRRIDITGRVDVPYARLEPAQFTDAVLASGDERLVNEQRTAPEEQFRVYSNVALNLGERVTINTKGLSGRLSGTISTSTDESGISRARGLLKVEEGKYTAYGRKLDIERGSLNFNNALLTDPGLELRATKRFPDITAGVNVRGTLEHPSLSFFSDPAVSQAQIVSLLLAGGSFESVQNNADPTTRANAARQNLWLQGSAILAQQTGLGSKLGLEDVSVEQDLNNETSLVLGRYLSPRLYLSYGIGIAEAINTLKLRYTIGDHWTIRTESGQARSADLLYSIER